MWSSIESKGNIPSPRWGSTIKKLPDINKCVLFGGLTFNSDDKNQILDNDFYILDLGEYEWSKLEFKGDYPEPWYLHSLETFGNMLIIFGGISCENQIGAPSPIVFGDVHICDLDSHFISKPFTANERPTPRYGHATAKKDQNSFLVLGGI